MSLNLTENCQSVSSINSNFDKRFVVFVAGGTHPIVAFENFARAERMALFYAGLVNVRMEVFDSLKEICYFIEPSELTRPSVH